MRTLLGCGKGSLRSRISVLIVEPPDLRLPRPAARTCARTPARRLAAVLAALRAPAKDGDSVTYILAQKCYASLQTPLGRAKEAINRID